VTVGGEWHLKDKGWHWAPWNLCRSGSWGRHAFRLGFGKPKWLDGRSGLSGIPGRLFGTTRLACSLLVWVNTFVWSYQQLSAVKS